MTLSLPARDYVSPESFLADRRVLRASWLFAAHERRLPEPHGAISVTVGTERLVLVRTAEGELRAFHNVCRHRAGPLLWEDQAEQCAALRCRYHGWQYDLSSGRLLRANGFQAIEASRWPLHPVPVASWRGLIFVWLGKGTALPLEAALGDLPRVTAALDLEQVELHTKVSHELRCNWKAYAENYLEGLHIPWMHPALSRDVSVRDYRVDVRDRIAVHRVPTRPGVPTAGLWIFLWPTLALNIYDGGLSLERMEPVGPGEMRLEYTYLFRPGVSPDVREAAIAQSTLLTREDARIVEAVQRNLESGVYQQGPLSPAHESGVAAFQQWRQQALGASVEDV